jgi:hypothetical protein
MTTRLIFFRQRHLIHPKAGDVVLNGDNNEFLDIIHRFAAGEIQTLYASAAYLTGWRVYLPKGTYEILFVGDVWYREQLAKGVHRIRDCKEKHESDPEQIDSEFLKDNER